MPLEALLWDVDGTIAETERDGHRPAFNAAFAEAGLPWHWDVDTYGRLLAISGGHERISAFLTEVEGVAPDPERVQALQRRKQQHYRCLLGEGRVELRPGVVRLMRQAAAAGLAQAIVTTSGREAVAALMKAQLPEAVSLLPVWICGGDVTRKKPDPEAYRLGCEQLGATPGRSIALEDSVNGLRAACGAGLTCLISRSAFSAAEPAQAFAKAAAVVDHLGEAEHPNLIERGPACVQGQITLSYLQSLLDPA
ncbi:HAD-IA family hydrolase [Synechococcus sp. CCY9201]|uniref:HAD-IA family hydrolase n=1 Tax=unclassified Synechococcus TaxID=2626047 RepID=UPI002AD3F6B7|nr:MULTISPECIES: HAD-IA family hydrolase [unclassified Synechococcus]MEA5423221.1 HAD-IA family hydrolase [Synechococcus sp. CCY9202]MEA5473729.1 HAD-IA family hydrolase [Synechococcus sp. CCY9201]CAK6693757.1 Protein CbbY [Synechococcus sp. CBW1107]